MPTLHEHIRKGIRGKSPLIYLCSSEEDRVVNVINEVAGAIDGESWPVCSWSCVTGFEGFGEPDEGTRDPVRAVQKILASDRKGLFVMKDLAAYMEQGPVIRALREFYYRCREAGDRFIIILAPELVVPEGVKKELFLVEVVPPDEEEIAAEIQRLQQANPDTQLPESILSEMTVALKGMALGEIDHVLHRIFQSGNTEKSAVLEEIFVEKEMVVKKTGYLEFCPPRWGIDGIGGLDKLKDWLGKRRQLFTREALEAGVPMPKGLLVMGVSGCGKSLAVKVISSLWNVPLFRLDMNLIFSGLYGSPETAFHRALKTIEAIAPAVLWIDEIENGLGLDEGGTRVNTHIFSAFLTWMQEKPPMVFIAATANRIHALPAEIIRKGRFDEVFFVDLPSESERREILEIHLRANGADPAAFDVEMLTLMMEGWNGAEIEQGVVSARIDAYSEGRTFESRDVSKNVSRIVPLSKTMEDQIKGIRDWAFGRATPASSHTKTARH